MPHNIPSPSLPTIRKRKWTREQLLKNLEVILPPLFSSSLYSPLPKILGTLSTPLPPDLPPSPPTSPLPGAKRKSDSTSDPDFSKRPRTTIPTSTSPTLSPLPPPPPQRHSRTANTPSTFNTRSEPSEDGELREDAAASASSRGPLSVSLPNVPVRRPRRGRLDSAKFDEIHDKYHMAGRMLKYSGDARFWSTYPTSHKDYKPLQNPPSPDSPYHKFGGLIARLELIDALVCFAYSIWSKEYSRNTCFKETWGTIDAFLGWCKHKWQAEEPVSDREKTFIGLIYMIEAFIHGRKSAYTVRGMKNKLEGLEGDCKKLVADAIKAAEQNPSAGSSPGQAASGSHPTPPMLPSPASIAQANSANSTPTNRADGTPSTTGSIASASSSSATRPQAPQPSSWSSPVPPSMLPSHIRSAASLPPHIGAAAASVTMPVGPGFIAGMKEQMKDIHAAMHCMESAQKTLTLPILARHFPTTFARMIHSTLSPHEEYEPDIEDEEGELYWPGQLVTGEGLGWVCLMGKAMVQEMGKEYGYRGLDGVVPKPNVGAGAGQGLGASPAPGPAVLAKR